MLELPVSIWLVDEKTNVLRATAASELLEEKIGNAEIPLDSPNIGAEVFRSRQTKLISNIESEKDWQFKTEIPNFELKSAIVAPLIVKNKKVGVLVIYVPEHKQLDLTELSHKAEASSHQIAATFRHIQGLETLNEVGQLINSEIKSPDIFKRVLESAQRLLDCGHVSIFLADINDNLMLTASSSPYVKRKLFKVGEGLIGQVVQSGLSLLVSDVRSHPKFIKGLSMEIEDRSMLLSPITIGDRIIGVISADFYGLNGFDNHDRILLEALTKQISTALQNRELYQKKYDKARALSDLHEIANDFLSIETLHDSRNLLEKIANISKTVLKADLIELYEYRQDQDRYILPHIIAGERIVHAIPKRIYDKDAVDEHIKRSDPLYIEDAQVKTDFTKAYDSLREDQPKERYIVREKIQSVAVIPLRTGNENMGLMFANYRTPQFFTREKKEIISLFAGQAAMAVKNSRFYEQLQRQREIQIEAIHQISWSIASPSEIGRIIEGILDWTITLMGNANLCEIRLLDKEANELVAMASRGETINEKYQRIAVGNGITGWVAQYRITQMINEVDKDSRYLPFLETTGSEIAVPIVKEDELIGVLTIENPQRNAFTENDLRLAESIANMAAIAIENARIYDELDIRVKKRTAELKAAYEISEAAHDIGSIENFYPKIHKVIKELIPYAKKNFRIGMYIKDSFEIVYCEDEHENLSSESLLKGLTGYVIRNAQPLICSPEKRNELIKKGEIELVGVPSTSWLGVPLKNQGNCIGFIVVQSYDEKFAYGEEEKHILIYVADQVAMAIQRVRTEEDLNRYRNHLEDLVKGRTLELEKANEELKELDKRKSEFLSTVSHELRTPLTPIKQCLENMLSGMYGSINEKQTKRSEMALACVNEEARLIENLLDLVRIQENRIQLEPEFGNIADILHRIIHIFEYDARDKKLELKTDIPNDNSLVTKIDKGKIRQIITNLVHNAIKFTEKGTITVSASIENNSIKICVSDTGIGVPNDQLEKIFDRFHQVDSSLTRKVGGTGIGLNITKNFIELHSGRIWVESEIGVGSTFSFKLPVIQKE